jgi:hypothetical protein
MAAAAPNKALTFFGSDYVGFGLAGVGAAVALNVHLPPANRPSSKFTHPFPTKTKRKGQKGKHLSVHLSDPFF